MPYLLLLHDMAPLPLLSPVGTTDLGPISLQLLWLPLSRWLSGENPLARAEGTRDVGPWARKIP